MTKKTYWIQTELSPPYDIGFIQMESKDRLKRRDMVRIISRTEVKKAYRRCKYFLGLNSGRYRPRF